MGGGKEGGESVGMVQYRTWSRAYNHLTLALNGTVNKSTRQFNVNAFLLSEAHHWGN